MGNKPLKLWEISKTKANILLIFSILSENIGSACLEACNGFTNIPMTIGMIVFYSLSFYIFANILHIVNLAIAYATWTAVGSLVCALLGQFMFGQILTPIKWAAIFVLMAGVVIVNLFGTPEADTKDSDGEAAVKEGEND